MPRVQPAEPICWPSNACDPQFGRVGEKVEKTLIAAVRGRRAASTGQTPSRRFWPLQGSRHKTPHSALNIVNNDLVKSRLFGSELLKGGALLCWLARMLRLPC
jgi:hypothetical protein